MGLQHHHHHHHHHQGSRSIVGSLTFFWLRRALGFSRDRGKCFVSVAVRDLKGFNLGCYLLPENWVRLPA